MKKRYELTQSINSPPIPIQFPTWKLLQFQLYKYKKERKKHHKQLRLDCN